MNEDSIKVKITTKVRYEFNLKKFAEYMTNKKCKDREKDSKISKQEYDDIYDDCYCYPSQQTYTDEDVEYMLNNGILTKLDEDKIDSEHIDEYLYLIL